MSLAARTGTAHRRDGDRAAAIGIQFHPEVRTPHRAPRSCATSSSTSAAARQPGRWGRSSMRRRQIRAQVGRRPGDLRPLGRRGFGGGGAAGASGDGRSARPASLSIPAACARARRSRWSRRSARICIFRCVAVDAPSAFSTALAGVTDPQEKRQHHRPEFIARLRGRGERCKIEARCEFLAQGTLYPDVIESASQRRPAPRRSRRTTTSAACPQSCGFELIEPLRDLFKDEVRAGRPRAGPARGVGLAASVPRPRPGGPRASAR